VEKFSRIAIVNRGEAAMRLIHAVRDLNAASAAPGGDGHHIDVIALHTEGERTAMFVREADIAYDLGPAANRPYLDHALLTKALTETRADAAWVGWGFVAEDPAFAELCDRIGVTFIGPSGEAMRKLGDKIGSKLIAEEVGVPVAPWSRGGVDSLEDALTVAKRWARHPQGGQRRRAHRGIPTDARRGTASVRLRCRLPREPRHRCSPRRGAGHRRRAGQCVGHRSA
jgi:biotin carboxylase